MSAFEDIARMAAQTYFSYMPGDTWPKGWKDQVRFRYQLKLTDGVETYTEETLFPHYYLRLWTDELRALEDDEEKIKLTITKLREEREIGEEEYGEIKESIWRIGPFIPMHRMAEFSRKTWIRPMLRSAPRKGNAKKKQKVSMFSMGELMQKMLKPNYPIGKPQTYIWKGKKHIKELK